MSKPVSSAIYFAKTPPRGTALMVQGQRYELIMIVPYVRNDGKCSSILHWQSHCQECQEVFITTSGLQSKSIHRRCPEHRKPGKRVSNKKSYRKAYQNTAYHYHSKKIGGRYGK